MNPDPPSDFKTTEINSVVQNRNRSSESDTGTTTGIGDGDVNSTNHHNVNNDDDYNIKIPIVGFETMEERAKFTVFKLRVENEKLGENWLVFRRYTDFVRLHSKLKEEFPNLHIPLPPKRWLRDNFETAFLEDRMKGLQAFVDSILMQQKLTESPTVREYFCLDEPPLYTDNAEESRSIFGTFEESMVMLKHRLSEKEAEVEILRTELALVSTQRDNILKLTRNCRSCTSRTSVTSSPAIASSEIVTGTPNASSTRNCNRTSSVGSNSNQNWPMDSPKHSISTTVNGIYCLPRLNGVSLSKPANENNLISKPTSSSKTNSPGSVSESPTGSADSSPSPKAKIKTIAREIQCSNTKMNLQPLAEVKSQPL